MMNAKDLMALNTASMVRINELARYCNLFQTGMRGVYWVRKSATSPLTRKEHFYKKSMGTADLRTAVIRALPQVEAFLNRILNPNGSVAESSGEFARVGELFTAYRSAPTVRANIATRRRNINDFIAIARLARGEDFDLEEASAEIISKGLAKDFQVKQLATSTALHGANLAALEASKRAMNSKLQHAQSLFSVEAMGEYSDLRLPATVKEFADAAPVKARAADEPQKLPDSLVSKLMGAMAAHKAKDAAVWTAFQLMVWGGLRNKECLHARVSWLEEIPAGYRLQVKAAGDFLPKGRSRGMVLPAVIVKEILAGVPSIEVVNDVVRRISTEDPHLVPGIHVTARRDAIYRRLNEWLRSQGVAEEANKVAYRLRKYFLKVVEEQQGELMAQAAAGHASLRTTRDHYTGTPKMSEAITLVAG